MYRRTDKSKLETQFCLLFSTQNGPARGMSADTAVCQQAAAVSYGQEGTMYSVMDGTLKSPTDPKIAALPAAGVALMGTYTGGAAPGVCLLSPQSCIWPSDHK